MARQLLIAPLDFVALASYTRDVSWQPIFTAAEAELKRIEEVLQKVQARTAGAALTASTWLFTPRREQLFRVFQETDFTQLKVVILAMDPYPGFYSDGTPHACGIAFSSKEVQASLRNIFAELKRSQPEFVVPTSGDLRPWCRQGVLLLNASLTHLVGSQGVTQKEIWHPFIYKVLTAVSTTHKHLAVCLWGRDAQSCEKFFSTTHLILKASHPSPLSANKGNEPFIGSNHFTLVNEYLVKHHKTPITWQL